MVREQRPAVLLDLRGADLATNRRICDAVLAELPGYYWADSARATPLALPAGGTPPDLRGLARPDRRVISVPFDYALAGAGLHPPEPDAPLGGRWTGAGIAVWFLLPRPDPGRWTLRLDIADWGNAAGGFSAEIDDRAVAPSVVTVEAIDYGPLELDRPCGGVLRATLFPPRAARDMQRGPRLIGLRILRAILLRGG
jgi:hypothetical protein